MKNLLKTTVIISCILLCLVSLYKVKNLMQANLNDCTSVPISYISNDDMLEIIPNNWMMTT